MFLQKLEIRNINFVFTKELATKSVFRVQKSLSVKSFSCPKIKLRNKMSRWWSLSIGDEAIFLNLIKSW